MRNFIVIGAGIIGASTAYHLAKNGASVILVDKKDYGEATRSAAGIVSPWLSQKYNPKAYEVIKNGARYYPELINELKKDGITNTSYGRVGSIHLHKSEDKLHKMVQDAKNRREDASDIGDLTILSGQDIQRQWPFMSDRMGAVHVNGGARVNGDVFRQALVEGAEKHGAQLLKGTAQLIGSNKVRVKDQLFEADKIIITNGAWAQQLLNQIGINIEVSSQKTQILHLEVPDEDPSQWPAIMLPNNKYIVGFSNHKVFVGSAHEVNEDFDSRSTASGVYEILKTAFKFAPGLEGAKFIESRVGFRPNAFSGHPIISKLPQNEHVVIANGLGSSGITSGPFLGLEIANDLLGKQTTLNLKDFHLSH
ncbi:FAD-binding oxidoreductase [Filobacillus milosensis]|uniref:FAD-binding oxidoreductase n=1 Tax=Filobacillus milosensis TaxID=94137 RepID=A0A4Y8II07_9BACI|nr:FAD-binding oxidoreductase [Filobacillus milosensis]TFB15107.1 FAD-binding oxidoreductase [Filobacillus milosensis]